MIDNEKVASALTILIKNAKGKLMRSFESQDEGAEVQGFFTIDVFERGKRVNRLCRREKNIWLLEGRAYSAMLKAYSSYSPDIAVRSDRIRYIGLGSGTQPSVSTITRLVSPIAWNASNHFLASTDVPTFSSDKTLVTWTKSYQTNDISLVGTVNVSEIGLFTDGVEPTYAPGTRDITLASATSQKPLCYKTFEPIPKTTDMTLIMSYTLKHN